MLTLEVYGQFVTWPEEFAHLMMKYYRNRGIAFVVHKNCIHTGWDVTDERRSPSGKTERLGAFEYACCYR